MSEDAKEILFIVLFFGLLLIIVVGTINGLSYLVEKNIQCPNFSKSVEKPVKYNFWAGGCFVQLDNGQWIKSNKYIGANVEN